MKFSVAVKAIHLQFHMNEFLYNVIF